MEKYFSGAVSLTTYSDSSGMLDINLFRVEKGGNPDLIKESQRKRGASVEEVDTIIQLDKEWVKRTVVAL